MTNEHERGVEAATDTLLLRAHELSARELAERAIAAYIEAVGFDSAPVLLSRIEELEVELADVRDNLSEAEKDAEYWCGKHTTAEAKLADAVKVIDLMADVVVYDATMQGPKVMGVNGSAARRAAEAARSFLQSLSQPGDSDD